MACGWVEGDTEEREGVCQRDRQEVAVIKMFRYKGIRAESSPLG